MRGLFFGCCCCVSLLFPWHPPAAIAAEPAAQSLDAQLAKLNSPEAQVRVAALRELQTSLDPRIGEALLPLLKDEGHSIRRLAARAVGSRWWQIPKEHFPTYIAALKHNLSSEHDGEKYMAERALGLLNRDYQGTMFAQSANKRWVIYERRGLPCLIDTKTETEELLGWSPDEGAHIAGTWSKESFEGSRLWHPEKEMVAFSMVAGRKSSAVWIWRHQAGLRKVTPEQIIKALGRKEAEVFWPGGFFVEAKEWKGDELQMELTYGTRSGEFIADHIAVLGWNVSTNELRVVSHEDKELR